MGGSDKQGRQLGAEIARLKQQIAALEAQVEEGDASGYRDLVERATDGIVILQGGVLEYVNPRFAEMSGRPPGEVIGTPIVDMVHPDDREGLRVYCERCGGDDPLAETFDARLSCSNGSCVDVELRGTLTRYSGKPARSFIVRDITDWKRAQGELRVSEARYRALFDQANDAIFLENESEEIVDVNQRACSLLGYSREELLALTMRALQANAPSVPSTPVWYVGATDRAVLKVTLVRRDGTPIVAEMTVAAVRDVPQPLYLLIVRDVTDRIQSAEKLAGLHDVAAELQACGDEDSAYRVTVGAAESILDFTLCSLDIAVGDRLVIRASSAGIGDNVAREMSIHEGLAGRTYRTKETSVFGDIRRVPEAMPTRTDFRSGISAPIGDIGVFQVVSIDADAFTTEDVQLLEMLLVYTDAAVKRIRLQQELEEQAVHDALTGVHNRHYLDTVLEGEVRRARRYGHAIGILMVDVNCLKRINDRRGHLVGDRVLCEVASLLQSHLRDSDTVVRYGGDEFLIVLPETSSEARFVVERIMAELGELRRTLGFVVTLAVGMAHWDPKQSRPISEVIAAADRRMYAQKRHPLE